jgi:hypothetical protein
MPAMIAQRTRKMEHRENMEHPETWSALKHGAVKAWSTLKQGALREQGVLTFHKPAPEGGGIH